MQPPLPRLSRFVRLCRLGVLLAALSALGTACDRHSATETPESYGHGSTHEPRDYSGHQIDSRQNSKHFSDTQGVHEEASEGPAHVDSEVVTKPGEKAAATPNPLGIGH